MNTQRVIFKIMVVSLLLNVVFAVCLGMTNLNNSNLSTNTMSDRIYITANHLDENDMPNCEKIYSNDADDIAVYYNKNYKPNVPDKGTKVTVDNCIKGEVINTDDKCIYVKVEDYNDIHYGLSGKPVVVKEKAIAFVSSLYEKDTLKCVLY